MRRCPIGGPPCRRAFDSCRVKRWIVPRRSLAPGAPTHNSFSEAAIAKPKRSPAVPSAGASRCRSLHVPVRSSRAKAMTIPRVPPVPGAPINATPRCRATAVPNRLSGALSARTIFASCPVALDGQRGAELIGRSHLARYELRSFRPSPGITVPGEDANVTGRRRSRPSGDRDDREVAIERHDALRWLEEPARPSIESDWGPRTPGRAPCRPPVRSRD